MDSMREGAEHQAETLAWQVRTAFELGVAGTCVFAWTDEWFTGGHLIEDWAFGLVDADRKPKPAFASVAQWYRGPLPPPLPRTPRVSVVVCAITPTAPWTGPGLSRASQLPGLRGHRRQ